MQNDFLVLETMDDYTDWSALSDETTAIASSTNHVTGTTAVSFDKVANGDNVAAGAIVKTVVYDDIFHLWRPQDYINWLFYLSVKTYTANAFIRLGTDASNYNEWIYLDASMTAARWNICQARLGNCVVSVGNGWNPSNVDYLVVGTYFDGADDTLTGTDGMVIDRIYLSSAWST